MNKIFQFLAVIIIISIIFSCAKDDEVPPSIIGRWAFDKEISFAGGVPQPEKNASFAGDPNCPRTFIEFKNNNIMSFGIYGGGCTLTQRENLYSYDGNYASLGQPFDSYIGKVLILNQTDLHIQFSARFALPGDVNALIFTQKFKRVL